MGRTKRVIRAHDPKELRKESDYVVIDLKRDSAMIGELQSLFRTTDSVELRTIIDFVCNEFLEGLVFGLGSEESEGFKYNWRHEVLRWVKEFKIKRYLEGMSDYE